MVATGLFRRPGDPRPPCRRAGRGRPRTGPGRGHQGHRAGGPALDRAGGGRGAPRVSPSGVALVLRGAAVAVASLALLGAFNYVLNQEREGNPLGGVREQTDRESPLYDNTVRIAWSFVDSPGASLPWLEERAESNRTADLRRRAQRQLRQLRRWTTWVQEDLSAFGLVGLALFLPLLLYALLAPRSPPPQRVVAGAGAPCTSAVFVVGNEYNIWMGRVLLPAVAIGAPLGWRRVPRPRLASRGGARAGRARAGAGPLLQRGESPSRCRGRRSPTSSRSIGPSSRRCLGGRWPPCCPSCGRVADPDAPLGLLRIGGHLGLALLRPRGTRRVVPLERVRGHPGDDAPEGLEEGIVVANVKPPKGRRVRPLAAGLLCSPLHPPQPPTGAFARTLPAGAAARRSGAEPGRRPRESGAASPSAPRW